jgi:hypothetical protein
MTMGGSSEEKYDGWRVLAYTRPRTRDHPRGLDPEVLAAPPGRVYTGDMTTPTQRPELEPDQVAQAVCVGLCLALAAVLLVLAGVVRAAL